MYFFSISFYRTDIKEVEKDPAKLDRNEKMADALEKAGIKILFPQRDVDQSMPKSRIYKEEIEYLKQCDGVIAVLSDTRGVYLEIGYAKALGKKIIGLKVDETRPIPPESWAAQWFDFIADDLDSLINYIKFNNL